MLRSYLKFKLNFSLHLGAIGLEDSYRVDLIILLSGID